jgi:uncharacterized membrane protein required for colicin V production
VHTIDAYPVIVLALIVLHIRHSYVRGFRKIGAAVLSVLVAAAEKLADAAALAELEV